MVRFPQKNSQWRLFVSFNIRVKRHYQQKTTQNIVVIVLGRWRRLTLRVKGH